MISQAESLLRPDKQGTPEEAQRIQRTKRCFTTNNHEDENKSPKNYTQHIVHQALSKKFGQIMQFKSIIFLGGFPFFLISFSNIYKCKVTKFCPSY